MKFRLLVLSTLCSFLSFSQGQLDEKVEQILSAYPSHEQPGLTLGIVKDGALLYHGSRGNMNLEYQLPFNDSTVFGLASVSKQFTAACIGILEKEGEIKLEEDVRKYIPELAQYQDTIKIKHLLNHTSGIRNHNVLLNLQGFDYEHRGYTNEMIEALMFQQKGVNNRPGEKMLYSNTNYVLLALIIKRVSGLPIHEFAQKRLFTPLNMGHTFYSSELEAIVNNRAHAYYKNQDRYYESKSLTLCVGAGGVQSTIEDLSKWTQVFLDPQHPLSYLKDFITHLDTLNSGVLMSHARGMFVSPYKGRTTFNHSGRDLGMRCQFLCLPEEDLAIIVFANSEDINAVNISYQILDLFLEDLSPSDQTTKYYEHSSKELKNFVGVYQELNSDLRMEVFIENDSLKAISSFGRNATPLVSMTKNTLCRIDNPSIKYSFQNERGEEADLFVDFGGAIFYFERVKLTSNPNQNLNEYIGDYYSEELNVSYSIRVEKINLLLSCPNNQNILINEGVKDTFGANRRTKYSFIRDHEGIITSFTVAAEGTVKDILFEKTN
jgi:CubicO group peptidase (beta-lactamase class C family)